MRRGLLAPHEPVQLQVPTQLGGEEVELQKAIKRIEASAQTQLNQAVIAQVKAQAVNEAMEALKSLLKESEPEGEAEIDGD
jgi:hypothetical protein